MKGFIGIGTTFSWFVLCVIAAFVLLLTALIYNGLVLLKKGITIGKLEFPNLKLAR